MKSDTCSHHTRAHQKEIVWAHSESHLRFTFTSMCFTFPIFHLCYDFNSCDICPQQNKVRTFVGPILKFTFVSLFTFFHLCPPKKGQKFCGPNSESHLCFTFTFVFVHLHNLSILQSMKITLIQSLLHHLISM